MMARIKLFFELALFLNNEPRWDLSSFFVTDILEINTQFSLFRILTESQLCLLLSEHACNWWGEGGKWDQVFSCRLRSYFVRTFASWLQVLGSATLTDTCRHCRPTLHPVVGSRRCAIPQHKYSSGLSNRCCKPSLLTAWQCHAFSILLAPFWSIDSCTHFKSAIK